MKRLRSVTFLAAACAAFSSSVPLSAQQQVYSWAQPTGWYGYPVSPATLEVQAATSGTFTGGAYAYSYSVGAGVQITVDPTAAILRFDSVQVVMPAFTLSRTTSLTVGFGQVATFVETYSIDAMTIDLGRESAFHDLQASTGGDYIIQDISGYFVTPPLTLTGSYSIQGPTESVTGEFSQTFSVSGASLYVNTLRTLDYPNALQLRSSYGMGSIQLRFSAVSGESLPLTLTVDGREIRSGLQLNTLNVDTGGGAGFPNLTPGTMPPIPTSVPEPATAGLIVALAALGLVRARRRTGN